MIHRIKVHNLLNGIVFSIVEFLVTVLLIAPFAVYYVLHDKVLYATITIGIILNCLMIVIFGIQQYGNKEKDLGLRHLFHKDVRENISREYPHLRNDTLILVITMLLPFIMFLWVFYELLFGGKR